MSNESHIAFLEGLLQTALAERNPDLIEYCTHMISRQKATIAEKPYLYHNEPDNIDTPMPNYLLNCVECNTEIYDSEFIAGYTNIYECPECGHPHEVITDPTDEYLYTRIVKDCEEGSYDTTHITEEEYNTSLVIAMENPDFTYIGKEFNQRKQLLSFKFGDYPFTIEIRKQRIQK
jgi:hypothetical protein